MTSIITGDIIHSQKVRPQVWLDKLKSELNKIGSNPELREMIVLTFVLYLSPFSLTFI